MTRRFTSLFPFLALLLLPCLLLWPVVFRGEAFLPADLLRDIVPWRTSNPASLVPWNPLMWDGVAEFYPWRFFYAETLKSGFLPLWNPHEFCGTPFLANSQSAVFYPLNLLFCLFPVWKAFGVSVLLHLFLTGAFAYLYLHHGALRLGRPASLLGAIAWQLCHWQTAWLALPTFLCVSAWLPLALLLVDRAAERPAAARAVPLGLCLGLMLLAGHLQIALYCFGLTAAYALFRVLAKERRGGPPAPILGSRIRKGGASLGSSLAPQNWGGGANLLGCAALTLALAFGLAAPQLLPAMELARMSHRAGGAATWDAYQGYVRLALPPVHLVTLFLPGFFGSPTRGTYWGIGLNGGPGAYMENACYSGVLTLLLALLGIVLTWRQNAATRFFSLSAGSALLLALGTPLNALLFFGIPGFPQTGSPGRILVLWSFCVPVLAAIGTEAILRTPQVQAFGKASAAFALIAITTLSYTIFWISANAPAGTLAANLSAESDLWRVPVGILLGAAAAVWLWKRGSLNTAVLGGALTAFVAVDLLAAGLGFNRTTQPQNVYPMTPLIAFLQAHADEGRIMPLNRKWSFYSPPLAVLPPNAATVYGLYDTQGYDSLLTGRYFQFAGLMDGGSPAPPENGNMVLTYGVGSKEAREAGARYVITQQPMPGKQPVFEGDGAFVYADQEAQPHIRLEGGKSESGGPAYLLLDRGPNRICVLMNDGFYAPRTMTVADQWYPGWRGYFSGKEVSLTPGPDIFRTLTLTPRQQNFSAQNNPLEMRYEPTAFRVGLYAFCLALCGAAAYGNCRPDSTIRRGPEPPLTAAGRRGGRNGLSRRQGFVFAGIDAKNGVQARDLKHPLNGFIAAGQVQRTIQRAQPLGGRKQCPEAAAVHVGHTRHIDDNGRLVLVDSCADSLFKLGGCVNVNLADHIQHRNVIVMPEAGFNSHILHKSKVS